MITCIRHTFAYEFLQDVRPSFPLRPVIDLLTSITFPWRPKGHQATRPVVSAYTSRSSAWRPLGRQGLRRDICLYLSLSNRSHDYRISPFYLSFLVLQPYATGLSESQHSPFSTSVNSLKLCCSAYFTTTLCPSLIYTPFRVGGVERRWPERVYQGVRGEEPESRDEGGEILSVLSSW